VYSGTGACWNVARDNKKNQIVLIQLAVRNHEELSKFLGFATVANGGEREMGLWVLRERKRGKRDLGWGQPWETVRRKEEEEKNWIGLSVVMFMVLIAKYLCGSFRLEGVLHRMLIEFNLLL
jgi:hypothetical protein